jgi:drug/metabolite transporter (DMT)-like permease
MNRKTEIGILAVLGVWISAGICLPMINVLKGSFTPEQILFVRGAIPVLIVLFLRDPWELKPDKYTLGIAAVIPFAALGLFKGVREWGANPTLIVVAATPVVNFVITKVRGRKIPANVWIGFMVLLTGVVVALHGNYPLNRGCAWAVFGTICNGLLYELFAFAKSDKWTKCFWASLGILVLGLISSIITSSEFPGATPQILGVLVLVGFTHGFLYWYSNVIMFERLEKDAASVLAQGETPAVIIGAWLLLGERLSVAQWSGVALALFGAYYVGKYLPKI